MSFHTTTRLAVISCCMLIGACEDGLPGFKDEYVAVIGRGTASQMPDLATTEVTLSVTDDTSKEATGAAAAKATSIITDLVDFGLAAEDISTKSFSVSPEVEGVEEDDRWMEKLIGYQARYVLKIKCKDLDRLGELLSLLSTRDVQSIEVPEYDVSDRQSLFAEARAAAIEDARQKAGEYATAVGRTLGAAEIIEEASTNDYRLSPTLQREFANEQVRRYVEELLVTSRSRRQGEGMFVPIVLTPIEVEIELYVKHELL